MQSTTAPSHPKMPDQHRFATYRDNLRVVVCVTCGIEIAIPNKYYLRVVNTHDTITCPNGHDLIFNARTRADRLEDRILDLQQRLAERDDQLCLRDNELIYARRQNAHLKGQLTKLTKKVARVSNA